MDVGAKFEEIPTRHPVQKMWWKDAQPETIIPLATAITGTDARKQGEKKTNLSWSGTTMRSRNSGDIQFTVIYVYGHIHTRQSVVVIVFFYLLH